MKKQIMPVETLVNYMTDNALNTKDIAERCESSVRSVQRWVQYGIPKKMWAMLQIKK